MTPVHLSIHPIRSTHLAAIDDLIAQIEDKALRARLKEEADRLSREVIARLRNVDRKP